MKNTLLFAILYLNCFIGISQMFQKINKLETALNAETDHKKLAAIYFELSSLYEAQNPTKAIENAQRSLTISKNLKYTEGEIKAYNQIGVLERKSTNYQLALDAHFSALRLNEKTNDSVGIVLSNLFIGKIFQDKEEYGIAENFYSASLQMSENINNSFCLSKSNSHFGDLNLTQGKNNLSLQYYLLALDNISLTNNIEEQGEIFLKIGKLYKTNKQLDEALDHLSKSLKGFEKTNNKEKQAILCYEIGSIYHAKNQNELALVYMKNSLGLAEQIGLKAYIKKGYENLSKVYERNGEYELAYEYLKYYIAIKDTREISELEAQLELEKKNREIQLLNKEKEFKAQELHNKNIATNIILFIFFIVILLALFLFLALKQKNRMNNALKLAGEDANRQRAEKEEFFAYTSHEIRTPLNAVVGMSKLLSETDLNTSQQNYMRTIKSSAQNILFLVNDVLDLSKIESGTIEFESVDFSIQDIVEEVINSLKFKIREKNVLLKSNLDPSIPEIIIGDPVRINQIILNLADNAIKFTSKGEVCVNLTKIKETESTISILFSVTDTGTGIRKSRINTIFDSYKQESTHTTRQYGGTGLGLAITKNLLQLMDSEIKVESVYGEGSNFHFELEFKKSESTKLRASLNQYKHIALNDLKILVVDDNDLNREIFFDLINDYKNNVEVDMADDGKMALLKIKQSDYDVVLMDIQMPRMDGYEATRQIRKLNDEKKSQVPIIAMTAHVLEGVAEKCNAAGMNDYISKPINIKFLTQIIKRYVKKDVVKKEVPEVTRNNEDSFLETTYVHLEELIDLTNNDYSKIEKYITIFFNNVPKDLKTLKDAFASKNWELLGKTAHKIKGNIGYMGINSIKDELQKLEKTKKEVGDLEEIVDIVNKVENVVEQAMKELEEIKSKIIEKI